MLELQDNMPLVWMNPKDAEEKDLAEGTRVEVFNSRGHVYGKLVYEPGLYPKQVVFEMGWWARYTDGISYNTLIFPFINPVHELYFIGATWSTNMAWNECVCDVREAM
jgi:anaerobic selenocysteine-containing dehydrogenase